MKSVVVLKWLTFLFGLMLLAGFAGLGLIITERIQKSKLQTSSSQTLQSKVSGHLENMVSCGDFLCLAVKTPEADHLLLAWDPKDGVIHQRLVIQKIKK